jgi:protein-L-isoaspartate(D-aspartate) O-methyltransferase
MDQLKEGGRMVIPVGERFAQQLYLLEKKNGKLKESATLPVRFVPMLREQKQRK